MRSRRDFLRERFFMTCSTRLRTRFFENIFAKNHLILYVLKKTYFCL